MEPRRFCKKCLIRDLADEEQKDLKKYIEWYNKTNGDDLCGPWIKDIIPEEIRLIDKIYNKFYGDDWYVSLPISTAQVSYSQYNNIKNKVIW